MYPFSGSGCGDMKPHNSKAINTCTPEIYGLLPVPEGPLTISGEVPPPTDLDRPSILLSVAIPTFRESQNIPILIDRLTGLLDQLIPRQYELIVIDDDSPDRTWEVAANIASYYPQLRVMRRRGERGLSTAVIRGWQVAGGEVLAVIDADLQHPLETILQLWSKIQSGADLAVASRHVSGGGVSDWSLARRILSRGAQMLGLIILPGVVGRVCDPMSGYFMLRRDTLANIDLNPVGYKILIEVLGRGRIANIQEVGYVFQERQEGYSKVTSRQYFEYLQHLLRLRIDNWPVGRFFRFAVVGFSGLFVDMAIFYLLLDGWGLPLTLSAVLSAEMAIINNFIWNDQWTFRDLSRQQSGGHQRLKRLLKFNLICLMGLGLNVIILNLLVSVLGLNAYMAKLGAIAIVTFWNFWVNLKLSWRVTEVKM
ncbi:glycosyltransferase [Arthrospira platensis]|uniref:glycosyltransferase n=2 Tax=Sirenicapillariaceae TaxID=2934961 RepID=UPI0001C392AB|nr:glycosyltransferase [Arthrospira platensis]MBD2710817.1 GtrA family protein [Arthrospira platensis FACHB-835]MDT9183229.1 GtrA family protein [Limnospira sp. PMC 289.06]MDT9295318.1 GtrA family protein [Arthrospira platensis PCC 7345]MDT9311065.1 GtrA family protein [Limnospira sp. Paracas R14]MBD2573020.1 GtrA family protein [Arthrospira platensis FACHB-971]